MKKVFIGLLFLFLTLAINGIDLLPSFVGYILIFKGIGKEREVPSGQTTIYIAQAGAAITGALWLWGIFGGYFPLPIGMAFQLAVTYRLLLWTEELLSAGDRQVLFRRSWYVLTAGALLSAIFLRLESGLSFVAMVVSLCGAAYYVYNYYQIWKDHGQSGFTPLTQPKGSI